MKIGVLAYHGSVLEHVNVIQSLWHEAIEVRLPEDLDGLAGLIIPGGESTTMAKLMRIDSLVDPIKKLIKKGFPVYGTCAGTILLAKKIISNGTRKKFDDMENSLAKKIIVNERGKKFNLGNYGLGVMDIEVKRNDYGRQKDSFEAEIYVKKIGKLHAIFIRAPIIYKAGKNVEILAEFDKKPVVAREKNLLVSTFHPELTNDNRIHKMFLQMVEEYERKKALPRELSVSVESL